MTRKLISIIVPTLNEAESVQKLYERIAAVFDGALSAYDWELVITDNRSTDGTYDIVSKIAADDDRVRAFRFAKNFGFQRSVFTGYLLARGDAVVQLDADMQDPPELIPLMVERWETGPKVVYGVRKRRHGERAILTASRRMFYRLINWLSEEHLPENAGDFRLVDRVVVDLLHHTHDASPYLRGTIASMGFEQEGIDYERDDRAAGKSKFKLRSLVRLGVDGILNHSTRPLQLASATAIGVVLIAIAGIAAYLVARLWLDQEWPAGFVSLALLQLVGILLNAAFLGIIGAYIGRMFTQGRQAPTVIIEHTTINEGDGLLIASTRPVVVQRTSDALGEGISSSAAAPSVDTVH
jgi:glycosyltransferase involved in cell wall biosynthesis